MARRSELIIKKDFGFEILGPPSESPEVIPGVILVPGLAFTERGERLGRGK
jgi:5-formyltetrahydrofolate cyclo-ligase